MRSNITESQYLVLHILAECEGWVCAYQISKRGGNTSAAMALERKKMIEQREIVSYTGHTFKEWRLISSSHTFEI